MKNKLAFWIITVIMSVLVIYSLVCIVVIPVITNNQNKKPTAFVPKIVEKQDNKATKKKSTVDKDDKDVKEEPMPDSLVASNSKEAFSKLFELRKAENFLESKMSLINDDSTYLVLDLIKNSADLELKGVSLHECKILDSHISNLIKDQPAETMLEWNGKPFKMIHEDATIPKVSWIIKYAPKDTIEANQAEELPEPPKRGDVYVVMDFDRNFRLIIHQAERPDKEGDKTISALEWKYKKEEIMKSLDALMHFKREKTKPTIEIVLSKADATILYRALPFKPKLLLRL